MAGDDRLFKDSLFKIDSSNNGDGFYSPNRNKFDLAVKQMQKQVAEEKPTAPGVPDGIPRGRISDAQKIPLSDGDALVEEALALLQEGRQSEGMELLRRGATLQQQAILQRPDTTKPHRYSARTRRRASRSDAKSASSKQGLLRRS